MSIKVKVRVVRFNRKSDWIQKKFVWTGAIKRKTHRDRCVVRCGLSRGGDGLPQGLPIVLAAVIVADWHGFELPVLF